MFVSDVFRSHALQLVPNAVVAIKPLAYENLRQLIRVPSRQAIQKTQNVDFVVPKGHLKCPNIIWETEISKG